MANDVNWPVGLMDKASASGAGDSRFESWAGHLIPNFAVFHNNLVYKPTFSDLHLVFVFLARLTQRGLNPSGTRSLR